MAKFFSPDSSLSIKDYQNANFEVLKNLIQFLNENQIEYWLYAGTLLGVIRHGDFIPWDDDIDIAMDEENYKKFKLLATKFLPSNLNFISDKKWYGSMCKIMMGNYLIFEKPPSRQMFGVFVDVFCFIQYPSMPWSILRKLLKYFYLIEDIAICRCYPLSIMTLVSSFIFIPVFKIYNLLWKVFPKSKTLSTRPIMNNNFDLHHLNDIFPLKQIKWRDITVNIPNDYNKFLAEQYGDNFMEIPPEDKRISHAELIIKNYE